MPSFRTVVSVGLLVVVMTACASDPPAEGTSSQAIAATITSIAVTPETSAIPASVQQQLKATAMYSNNTKKALSTGVTWSVDDPSVASVSSTGLVTALHPGVVTITVHQLTSGISGVATLTVTSATLASIAISPAKRLINVGVAFTFKAIGKFSDGTKFRLTNGVTWSSTSPAIATIDGSGTTTGIAAGTVAVTASVAGLTAKAVLTVGTATLTSVAITPATASLPIGATQSFIATGTYSDNTTMDLTGVATWTSSKPAVATMSTDLDPPGVVTGVAVGKATITAKVAGVRGTAVVTVKAVTLTSIAVTPALVSLPNGTTQQLRATGMYSDHTTRDLTAVVTWSSSSAAVAVSNGSGTEGLATAIASGAATITAIDPITSLSGTSAVTVTAAVLEAIAVTPPAASVALGYTQPYVAMGTYSDGTQRDLTTAITWSASPATVAAISNDADTAGLAISLAIGTATVTALDPATGISGTAQLAITAATLVSLTITPGTASIPNGFAQRFTATGTYSDHTVQDLSAIVTWSVPVGSATISNVPGSAGVATSNGVGANTVSAVDPVSGQTATASLQVTAAIVVALTISPQAPTVEVRQSLQLTALGTFSDHTTSDLTDDVTWIPSNADVAVSNADGSRGLATGLVEGSATITAIDPTTSVSATDSITIDDRCSPNPCEQGGVCVDGPSSYTCTCPPGTAGTNCEAKTVTLETTIRDFHNNASDFNALLLDCTYHQPCGDADVFQWLGLDAEPTSYVQGESNATTFSELWTDTPGINLTAKGTLTLSNAGQSDPSVFAFTSAAYHPVDGQLFGNEGGAHNDFFTVEAHSAFVYTAGSSLSFSGPVAPDNLWVFVNHELVLTRSGTLNLDAFAVHGGLTVGETYPLEIFFAHSGGQVPALSLQIIHPACSYESAKPAPIDPSTAILFGSAISSANMIQLVPATVASSSGAAWRPTPLLLSGFRSYFQFRFTQPTSVHPEGFAVVLAARPGRGGSGENLGYVGLGPSIAVEFDTAQEADVGDPGFPQVSIHTMGANPNIANEALASIGASGDDDYGPMLYVDSPDYSGGWIKGAIELVPVPSQSSTWIRVYLDMGDYGFGGADPWVPWAQALVSDEMLTGALGSGSFYIGITASSGANNANEVDIANWTFATTDCRPGLSCTDLSPSFTSMTAPAPVHLPQSGSFVIQARDAVGTDVGVGGAAACFAVMVTNGSAQAPATITDNRDGTYGVSFAPGAPGAWEGFTRLNGIDISGSPAAVSVLAP